MTNLGKTRGARLPEELDEKFEEYQEKHSMSKTEAVRSLIEAGLKAEQDDKSSLWNGAGLTGDFGMLATIAAMVSWLVVSFGPIELTLTTFLITGSLVVLAGFLIVGSFILTVAAVALEHSGAEGSSRSVPDVRNVVVSVLSLYDGAG